MAALLLLYITASAQTYRDAGTLDLGGDISFSSQSYTNDISSGSAETLTMFSFNPFIGVMAAPGFEVGVRTGLGVQTYREDSYTNFNILFAPSYNVNTHSGVIPYFEFLIGYNSVKETGDVAETGLAIGGDGGVKVAIGTGALLLFKIEYLHQEYNQVPQGFFGTPGTLSLNTTSIGVGVRIFIPKKEKAK